MHDTYTIKALLTLVWLNHYNVLKCFDSDQRAIMEANMDLVQLIRVYTFFRLLCQCILMNEIFLL